MKKKGSGRYETQAVSEIVAFVNVFELPAKTTIPKATLQSAFKRHNIKVLIKPLYDKKNIAVCQGNKPTWIVAIK